MITLVTKKTVARGTYLDLYVYLSDVDEGGGTHFPELNVTVTPKRRAVLGLCSNDDPIA
jgi:hypothetical protein